MLQKFPLVGNAALGFNELNHKVISFYQFLAMTSVLITGIIYGRAIDGLLLSTFC